MRRLLAALLALSLAACATVQRYDAAGDVHALMVSIRDDDRAVFDAHVDRTALKAQLRARLMAGAIGRGDAAGWGGVLGVIVGGPLIDGLVDALVQPPVFLAIAEAHGYAPPAQPHGHRRSPAAAGRRPGLSPDQARRPLRPDLPRRGRRLAPRGLRGRPGDADQAQAVDLPPREASLGRVDPERPQG
jgi:hypothetical protein